MFDLQYFLTVIPAAFIAISFHEMSHGLAALMLGDKTAQYNGRLSLNPLSHIDPLGFICMILFRFGWAKPVPINPNNFKNPRVGMALTAFAGPLSNFVLAFAALFGYVVIVLSGPGRFMTALATFLMILGELSVGLGIFNLIPIPPLDGSKIAFLFLPRKAVRWFYEYEGYIRLALLLGLYFGFFDGIIGAGRSILLNGIYNAVFNICLAVGLV